MAKTYHLTPGRKLANTLMRALLHTDFQPGSTYLLTVKGRKSGRLLTTPVTLVEEQSSGPPEKSSWGAPHTLGTRSPPWWIILPGRR